MQETVRLDRATGRNGSGTIVLEQEDFSILHNWMELTEGRLRTSVGYVCEMICDDFQRRKGITNLRVADYSLYVEEFSAAQLISWRYRCCSIVGDGTYLIEYHLYDGKYGLGNFERRLAQGSIRLKPKNIKATP